METINDEPPETKLFTKLPEKSRKKSFEKKKISENIYEINNIFNVLILTSFFIRINYGNEQLGLTRFQ